MRGPMGQTAFGRFDARHRVGVRGRLRAPSSVVDWRIVETMPPTDPCEAH
jgi:hypothetical protein